MAGYCDTCGGLITAMPVFTTGLNTSLFEQNSGVAGLILLDCSSPFTDVTDDVEWQTKITARELFIVRDCLSRGGVVEAPNVVEDNACSQRRIKNIPTTLTLTTPADNITFDRNEFWENVRSNYQKWLVAYWFCDDINHDAGGNSVIRGFISGASVLPRFDASGETRNEPANWIVDISWFNPTQGARQDAPVSLGFNLNTLTGI